MEEKHSAEVSLGVSFPTFAFQLFNVEPETYLRSLKQGQIEMGQRVNSLGQAVGDPVENWEDAATPPRTAMDGHYCRVEPIDPDRHGAELLDAFLVDREQRIWTYLPYGPFDDVESLKEWIKGTCLGDDPMFHAIVDKSSETATGVASYLGIKPKIGTIEVGHINYSPLLQRKPAATEAMYLLMRRVFDELGYRRFEWKCDALNSRSCSAAERLGFQREGIFRQATMYKGRNRDTAWFSIIDKEWPHLAKAFEAWLHPENFDSRCRQKRSLGDIRNSVGNVA